MAKKPKPKPDDPEQSKRFREAAREHETDESGKAFRDFLENVLPRVRKPKS